MSHPTSNPATDDPDRRRDARQTMMTKAMLYPEALPAAPQRVFVSDISHLGVGFRTATPFEPGERFRLKIEAGPMRLSSHLQIVNCRAQDQNMFQVGAQFIANELVLNGDRDRFRRAESVPRNPSRELRPAI